MHARSLGTYVVCIAGMAAGLKIWGASGNVEGHNLPPLVEIGLIDLQISGGAASPPPPPGAPFRFRHPCIAEVTYGTMVIIIAFTGLRTDMKECS